MALSKPVGIAAAITGALGGAATVVTALAKPDVATCVQTIFAALGPHGVAIGGTIVGLITGGASIVALYAHPPVPLSPQQQHDDIVTHAVAQ